MNENLLSKPTFGLPSQPFGSLVGRAVWVVKKSLQEVFTIPPTASPIVNGQEVPLHYRLMADDVLEFKTPSEQKVDRTVQPAKISHRSDFLTLREAAAYLGYDESWFWRIVKSGVIKHWQRTPNAPIKFKKEWLDEFVEESTTGGSRQHPTSSTKQRRKTKYLKSSEKTFGLDPDLMT